jgi:hypothetical protein
MPRTEGAGEWSTPRPGHFSSGIHWTGGWMDPQRVSAFRRFETRTVQPTAPRLTTILESRLTEEELSKMCYKTGDERITWNCGAFLWPLGVCSLSYPACTGHTRLWYCHLWAVWLYQYFSTLSHKGNDFGNKVMEYKTCVLVFSTNLAWNSFPYKKNSARYYQKCTDVFMQSTPEFKRSLNFSRQTLENTSNIKFHENPSSESQVAPCGPTEKHDKADSRFPQFCERAEKCAWVGSHIATLALALLRTHNRNGAHFHVGEGRTSSQASRR